MFLVNFFVKKPLIAIIASLLLAIAGITSSIRLKRSMFPPIDLSDFNLKTPYYGASPSEVELNVTNKIEDKLKPIEGIDKTWSISTENHSFVLVWVDLDHPDPDEVKKNILDAIERIPDFPKGVGKTDIEEFKTSNLPVIGLSVLGGVEKERRKVAKIIEEKIRMIRGVSGLTIEGYRKREIKIELDLEKLRNKKISLIEVG